LLAAKYFVYFYEAMSDFSVHISMTYQIQSTIDNDCFKGLKSK